MLYNPLTLSEKAYLRTLCEKHQLTAGCKATYGTYTTILGEMNVEAARHHEGGNLFDTDPWAIRTYTAAGIGGFCRYWLRTRARLSSAPNPVGPQLSRLGRKLGMLKKLRIPYIAPIPCQEQLPSLGVVLSLPNDYHLSILDMRTRLVPKAFTIVIFKTSSC